MAMALTEEALSRDEALRLLTEIGARGFTSDTEADHAEADEILVRLIGDAEIAAAYEAITKWYA